MTTKQFIEKARSVHGDKYDYSKTEYVNSKTKVIIICPEHGEFEQRPSNHLLNHGCHICSIIKNKNDKIEQYKAEFVQKARSIHGDKYDYSKVDYKGSNEKVTIICKEHGKFEQIAYNHLYGFGCPKCGLKSMADHYRNESAKSYLGDMYNSEKYEYLNECDYTDCRQMAIIRCKTCGNVFEQTWRNHKRGNDCPICSMENSKKANIKNREIAKEELIKLCWDGWDTSEFQYNGYNKECGLKCKECGLRSTVSYGSACNGHKCGNCYGNKAKTLDEYINMLKSIKIDYAEYDYSEAEYKNAHTKIKIFHKKCGKHFYMSPNNHKVKGCPYCKQSRLEIMMASLLDSCGIQYERQKWFPDLVSKNGGKLKYDFYIKQFNVLIEMDGPQHKIFVERFHRDINGFIKQQERDDLKTEYAKYKGYRLLRYDNSIFKKDKQIIISEIVGKNLLTTM